MMDSKSSACLHDAARLLRKRFEARGKDMGLSSAQWRLLIRLLREGRASQARLAEIMEIEPISVSRLVDRMAEAGWVAREPDANDRRVRIVVPTQKATDAFVDIREMADAVYDDAMVGMTKAERLTLIAALVTVVKNLSNDEPLGICPLGTEAVT